VEQFEKLKQFAIDSGHPNVPSTWVDDKKLAGWVVRQRVVRKRGKLDEDKICQLNELGFRW
jgi:hypothetical protein